MAVAVDPTAGIPRTVSSLLRDLRAGVPMSPGMGPIGTGFDPLDAVLDGGLLPGEVILLGGRPGAGKTICALQWARHIAGQSVDVVYACFEHDEATLLNRLMIQELATRPEVDATERIRARTSIKELTLGTASLAEAVNRSPVIGDVVVALEQRLPYLQLLRASTRRTSPVELELLIQRQLSMGGVLFVDYLQKVAVPDARAVEDQVHRAMGMLKELAVTYKITVVALSAAGPDGINADRLRLHDLRGADALAHECDVAIVMNHKATAVSDRHLKFDLTQLDDAKRRMVFSVEKNRRGEVDVHLQFEKDFANFRFVPRGAFLTEAMEERHV